MRKLMMMAGCLLLAGHAAAAQHAAGAAMSMDMHAAMPGHDMKAGHDMKMMKKSDAALIARAMSAGPVAIAKEAAIMAVTDDGKMREVRAGKNGWMCMVDATGSPMCLDQQWQAWADAWVGKKEPQIKGIGMAYMLKGDTGASNTDPYATKPTADNHWVVSGPHVMILTPDLAQLDALPTDPWNGGPWVMWKGTKYAHIMMPTAPMPKPKKLP